MRAAKIFIQCTTCGVSLSLLSACAAFTGYPTNYQNAAAVVSTDAPYLAATVRTSADAGSQQYRDRVVFARLEVIDINYYAFEAKLNADYDSLSLGSDLGILLLNGLGATTGSAATKSALAAASAGIVGANGAVNTDVFYKKTLPALIAEMRAARQAAMVPIAAGIKKPTSQYSLDQALADVNAYYVAGTIPSAISNVNAQAGARLSAANDQLAIIRLGTYVAPTSGSSAAQILAWLYPNGDETKPVNVVNLQRLTAWMNAYTADPLLAQVPYQTLLTGSGLPNAETDRQSAIRDLQIPRLSQ